MENEGTAASFCGHCGHGKVDTDRFCAKCGRGQSTLDQTSDAEQTKLARYARNAKIAALIAFILPWVTASCAGHEVASVSGLGLAIGVASVRNPLTGVTSLRHGHPVMVIAIGAGTLIGTLFIGLKADRSRVNANFGLSLMSLMIIVLGAMDIIGKAQQQANQQGVQIQARYGLWITCALLGLSIFLQNKIRKNLSD